MPTYLYLTTHLNAKRVRQLRSNFLIHQNSLGLSGSCEHPSIYKYHTLMIQVSSKYGHRWKKLKKYIFYSSISGVVFGLFFVAFKKYKIANEIAKYVNHLYLQLFVALCSTATICGFFFLSISYRSKYEYNIIHPLISFLPVK